MGWACSCAVTHGITVSTGSSKKPTFSLFQPRRISHPPNPPIASQSISRAVPLARARVSSVPYLPKRSRQTGLQCAHRTSTVSSCAFCEQEGWSGGSLPILLRPRVARAQKIIRLHPLRVPRAGGRPGCPSHPLAGASQTCCVHVFSPNASPLCAAAIASSSATTG
jgi:hypothetical protein